MTENFREILYTYICMKFIKSCFVNLNLPFLLSHFLELLFTVNGTLELHLMIKSIEVQDRIINYRNKNGNRSQKGNLLKVSEHNIPLKSTTNGYTFLENIKRIRFIKCFRIKVAFWLKNESLNLFGCLSLSWEKRCGKLNTALSVYSRYSKLYQIYLE